MIKFKQKNEKEETHLEVLQRDKTYFMLGSYNLKLHLQTEL